ncbi:glutamine amidotransferase domain-containing protein [Alcanivorax balearicus MACL04]|uniref:Glutamine amidotransferase domain-containing protein n=1 Tax=Alloalcanivorax balearicus MACL04 TaxID=1177182 RepID=A0ABT2QW08_9GAMM|nr:type 1 glutamine amidotransferase [Alloalcanivorax balearicus]MCU5781707.1 glutamine amidotransferase domain-containing protein [Alloalcanivorax balearicus MACL04]
MRIHYLTHVPFEKLGAIEPWLAANGARITATRLYHGEELPDPDDLDALIVMGGPMSADDEHRYPWLADEKRFIRACIDGGHKVLGICLGAQLIARALGARVHKNPDKEIGFFPVQSTELGRQHPLGSLFNDAPAVFHWHGDTFEIPNGALHLAHSWGCEHQAFSYGDNVLALQFHLEMGEDNVRTLCQECAADLSPGPWTQSITEILSMPQIFTANQRLLSVLLGRFFGMPVE